MLPTYRRSCIACVRVAGGFRMAQTYPPSGPEPQGGPQGRTSRCGRGFPRWCLAPRSRRAEPQPPKPPFMLTPQEQAQVDARAEPVGAAEPRHQDVRLPVQAVDLRRGVRPARTSRSSSSLA